MFPQLMTVYVGCSLTVVTVITSEEVAFAPRLSAGLHRELLNGFFHKNLDGEQPRIDPVKF